MIDEDRLLLRPEEVCRLLGLSRSLVYRMMADHEIPGVVRIGGSIRVSASILKEWVASLAAGESHEDA